MSGTYTAPPSHRSYLYASGARPDIMAKAILSTADAVILDLEDAVAPSVKARALEAVHALLTSTGHAEKGPELHVRVNRSAHGYELDEVRVVSEGALSALRLPKTESAESVRAVGMLLDSVEPEGRGIRLYPTIESATGLTRIAEIAAAHPRVARFALGATDLLADLAAQAPEVLLHAQNRLVLDSRAAGLPAPVDCVHTDVGDLEGLAEAARRGRALGFFGKSVIHPCQLKAVHAAFTPGPDEVERAREVVETFDEAEAQGEAAILVEGRFIDLAVAQHARSILRWANHVVDESEE